MTTNIKDLPEDKLLELLCTKVLGWTYKINPEEREFLGFGSWHNAAGFVCLKSAYNPLAHTIQGKGQALELVERFPMYFVSGNINKAWCDGGSCMESISTARAIVLAAVASVCGEEMEL